MKRTFSILLALIIALSAFSMAAFAEEAPQTKTDALIEKLCNADELQLSCSPGEFELFDGVICSGEKVYAKGKNFVVETKSNRIPIRFAVLSDTCYIYSPILPFIYTAIKGAGPTTIIEAESLQGFIKNYADEFYESYTYAKSYEEKADGEAYTVEEYRNQDGYIKKHYYKDDTLKFIITFNSYGGSYGILFIDSYSFDVNEKILKKPIGFEIDFAKFESALGKILNFFNFIVGIK